MFLVTLKDLTAVCKQNVVFAESQVQRGSKQMSQYSSSWNCARQLYHQGGVTTLYRGTMVTLLRGMMSSEGVVMMTSYDIIRCSSLWCILCGL